MARRAGEWLSAAGQPSDEPRGARLGLPAEGPASVASVGRRVVAFVLDLAAGALIGGLLNLVVPDPDPLQRTLAVNGAFAVQYVVLTALAGQTIGMRLVGLRVLHLPAPAQPPGFVAALVRTALLMLVLPAVVFDRDGRGLHDKAARTVVVRAWGPV